MADESALFIDFENIRYSMLNIQHREPDPQELINVARRYGTVMVAKAYADWSRQPEIFKGSLMAAMIDRMDCPAKQRGYRPTWQSQGGYSAASNGRSLSMEASANDQDDLDEDEEEEEEEIITSPQIAMPNSQPTYSSGYGIQSTVDLNMLMDIIETVFDRPSIQTFVLMTGDRDFTRICARLKLRLNKFVVVAGVPGTVSRDLTAAANQFVLLGNNHGGSGVYPAQQSFTQPLASLEPTDPQFLQFLDYIDRHWAWRTIIGVSNFIGDPYNHKNRFRGRLTRESARELLMMCIQQGILLAQTDAAGNEDLRLNRANPLVESALANQAAQQQQAGPQMGMGMGMSGGPGPYSQMGPWTQGFGRHSMSSSMEDDEEIMDDEDEGDEDDLTADMDIVPEDVESN